MNRKLLTVGACLVLFVGVASVMLQPALTASAEYDCGTYSSDSYESDCTDAQTTTQPTVTSTSTQSTATPSSPTTPVADNTVAPQSTTPAATKSTTSTIDSKKVVSPAFQWWPWLLSGFIILLGLLLVFIAARRKKS